MVFLQISCVNYLLWLLFWGSGVVFSSSIGWGGAGGGGGGGGSEALGSVVLVGRLLWDGVACWDGMGVGSAVTTSGSSGTLDPGTEGAIEGPRSALQQGKMKLH